MSDLIQNLQSDIEPLTLKEKVIFDKIYQEPVLFTDEKPATVVEEKPVIIEKESTIKFSKNTIIYIALLTIFVLLNTPIITENIAKLVSNNVYITISIKTVTFIVFVFIANKYLTK